MSEPSINRTIVLTFIPIDAKQSRQRSTHFASCSTAIIQPSLPHSLADYRLRSKSGGTIPRQWLWPLTFEELARLVGISERNVERFEKIVHRRQEQDTSTCPLFSGIEQEVKGLAEKHIITVITSSDSSAVEAEAARLGLGWPIVAKVLGPDYAKAKSERILQCCQAFNHSVDRTYIIGDGVSDVRQGKAAGVKTIAVPWGFQDRARLENEKPTHIIDHPAELLSIL